MMTIKSIHKIENKFDKKAQKFAFRHPYISFVAMFVGVPCFMLCAVTLLTVVITFPMALLEGWL